MPQCDPAPQTHEGVLHHYRGCLTQHQGQLEALKVRQRRLLFTLAAVVLLIGVQTSLSIHSKHSAWPMLVTFAAVVGLIGYLIKLQDPITETERTLRLYECSLERADGTEPHSDGTGEQALPPRVGHLYERDLDITGRHSLFSLLGTMRTGIGERGLARYLLEPATYEETLLRQQAVKELQPQIALREKIAMLGSSRFQQLSADYFDRWLNDPPPAIHPVFRYALLATTAAVLALLLAGIVHIRPWGAVLPNLLAALALQAAIASLIRKRVLPLLEGGARLQGQVRLFAEGIQIMQRANLTSGRLVALQRLSREPAGAVKALHQLDGHLVIVEARTKEYFFVLSLMTAAGSHAGISIAAWKRRHVEAMRTWLAAWGEFEALNALATYAFEHPEHAWPELLPPGDAAVYEATGLGHPLLPAGVRNDIVFNPAHRFLLISGSNMAGKSTLMRSIGTNAILAYAGAPVRATSLRLTPLTVGASIALTDSLAEGKSKFRAEVERLAAIVQTSATRPVLFLVDEIFSGTNSLDRQTAAAAVLRSLLAHGAIGALSTHDLALTSLATQENEGANVHMASPDPADPLAFDYVLKPGINQSSNALAIIRMMGLNAG